MKFNGIAQLINYFYLRWQNFKELSLDMFSPLYVKVLLAINILLNLALWGVAYKLNTIVDQDLIILHYNVDFGVKMIGSIKMLYIIPALGLLLIMANTMLLMILKRQDNFLTYLLYSASMLAGIFLLISLGMLYLINF